MEIKFVFYISEIKNKKKVRHLFIHEKCMKFESRCSVMLSYRYTKLQKVVLNFTLYAQYVSIESYIVQLT